MRVLVAYASKYGSTRGIDDFMGEKLRQREIEADVKGVNDIEDLAPYDAFVIGSAVYMYHWMKEGKQFVLKNRKALSARPVWLFSSGPVGKEAKDAKGRDLREVSGPKELDELRDAVKARGHHVIFGAFYGSRLTGMHALGYKMARKSKEAREAMPEGDFRDWKEIEAWAAGISGSLAVAHPPASA